jgi:hypothetical protein
MGSAAHYGGIRIDIQIQKEFKLMVENHDIEKMCTTIHGNSVRTTRPTMKESARRGAGWWTTIMRRHPKAPNTGGSSRASSLA